ncbi:MAG: ATP-binding protein [Chthoniobacteraceae bacterium]
MKSESPTRIVFRKVRDPARAPVRILCVEDNDGDFGLIRAHLKDAAFSAPVHVERAQSLADTLRLLSQESNQTGFDIVLLDLSLPDSHGVETYKRIHDAAPHMAVAILSGDHDEALALDLVQHGAQDYLPKDSLTPDLLMRCIIYAMKRQLHRVEMEKLAHRLQRTADELKTAQMQLIQAEKIESLGRLASSVAHEVKNPLGVIQMGLDFLGGHLENADADIKRTLELMEEAVARADSVIFDMLDFSRTQEVRMISCDVNDIVHSVVRMLKHEFDRRKISLEAKLATAAPRTECDANGIRQVLINVVMNSLQAMDKGGHLTLRTLHARAEEIPRDPGLREMNRLRGGDPVVVIEVQDQGSGIPEENMGRIFEPFFTTKPAGQGTGLGLSVCRRIVELHRGQLLFANVSDPRGLRASIVLKAEPDFESEPAAGVGAAPAS